MVYAGTIIEINDKKTYLMTMDLNVVAIKTKSDYFIGEAVNFSKKDQFRDTSYLRVITSPKFLAVAAAVVLILSTTALVAFTGKIGVNKDFDTAPAALISVDINPSIELEVNKANQIISATSVNEDGQQVLDDLDLEEKDLSDGVDAIVSASDSLG